MMNHDDLVEKCCIAYWDVGHKEYGAQPWNKLSDKTKAHTRKWMGALVSTIQSNIYEHGTGAGSSLNDLFE